MSGLSPATRPLADPDPALRAIVVVPARDEAARIGDCLRALAHQRGVAPASYEVIVILDGCRDRTAAVLRALAAQEPELRVHAVALAPPQGVGRARRHGMDLACERLLEIGGGEGLIASTDADSIVAEDWLACQLALARGGARAIGGHIELHPQEADALTPRAVLEREGRASERMRALLERTPGDALAEHHQFSGASLALTADTYRRCGGLPVRAALEDEALEHELQARGVPIHRSRSVRVSTSARVDGRAPRGLARDLARSDWRARRSYTAEEFSLERLLQLKRCSIALVLPAREVLSLIHI